MTNNTGLANASAYREWSELFIGGTWTKPTGRQSTTVLDSFSEEPLGRIPGGTREDVDHAVRAAAAAQPVWAATPPAERAGYLRAVAERLRGRSEEIVNTVSVEVGTTRALSEAVQIGVPLVTLEVSADVAESFSYEERLGHSLVQHVAVGVVGSITPWNYPLHQMVSKVAPALAAGCAVVAKPAGLAPLTAFIFAECVADAGLPPGVFNLVSGPGASVGEAIASHPQVDCVSLTGSTASGRRVASLAAQTIKRVTLELGGKSPNLLLDDLDADALQTAVRGGVTNCFRNTGQTCTAQSRMLVPASRHGEIAEMAAAIAEEFKLGSPLDPETTLGPVVSSGQRESIWEYIRLGVSEGAQLMTGGAEPPEDLEHGYFVRPTIFAGARNDMRIAQEEIFGPVLTIIPYADEDEAVAMANDSIYGLSGGVWAADPERAVAVAGRLHTGQVMVNGATLNPRAPFGGFKQSGLGRELGEHGFREFLETRSVQLPTV